MLIRITKLEMQPAWAKDDAGLAVAREIRAYINPERVSGILFAPDGFEGFACIQCDANEHWVYEQDADKLVEHINQTPAPAAPAPAPKMTAARLVSMTRDETKNSRSPMWRCGTEAGFMVNVFKHDDPLKDTFQPFFEAGYDVEMLSMNYGDTLTWTRDPIDVELVQNGSFWNVVKVDKRPAGALPDEPEPEEVDLESAGYDGMGGTPWEGSTPEDSDE